jgi:NAD(P)-dependent dehydrogenase (short-subunit alcohol dehydrogenase family)
MMCTPVLLLLIIAANCIHAEGRPVVITGASGRTGSIIYGMLKQRGVDVRGFVRNATKAKEVLKCNKCDESEGIYVGDITKPASLVGVMDDASALVITTGAVPVCSRYDTPNWWDAPNCYFLPGNTPAEIDWLGGKNQVYAFGNGYQHESIPGRIFLVSEMGMTDPTAFLERLGTNATTGHVSFYKKVYLHIW